MPRSPKDNLEIREARQEAILDAALRVFAVRGYAGAKISQIAAEAGLSHGLVYHYFDSKEAILIAIADSMGKRLEAEVESTQGRAIERLRLIIERRCTTLAGPIDPSRLVLQTAMQGSLPDSVRAKLQTHLARFAERLRDWVAEAQAQGDVDDAVDADQIMRVLSYAMRGMCLRVQGQAALPLPLPTSESILALLLPPRRTADGADEASLHSAQEPMKGQRPDA